jgi:hypothetical protein
MVAKIKGFSVLVLDDQFCLQWLSLLAHFQEVDPIAEVVQIEGDVRGGSVN